MSDKLARTSLNFEFFKRINTDLTPFEAILYFYKNSNRLLVENPNKGTCYTTWKNEIKKYIKMSEIQTSWEPLIDGSWTRIKDSITYHIFPLTKELEFVNLSFVFNMFNNNLEMIRTLKEKNFKINKVYSDRKSKTGALRVSAFLPMWPLWAMVKKEVSGYALEKMYIKVDDEFYRFPYGNINSTDGVCLGGGNTKRFTNPHQMWVNFVTTPFNTDYAFNLRTNRIQDLRRFRNQENSHLVSIPSFNLEEISIRLSTKKYDHISFLDGIYYLSNIKDFEEFIPLDMLYKMPHKPWEKEKE
jgi:hypothetical protein